MAVAVVPALAAIALNIMQALVVEFRIKPEFVRDFEVAIEENARASRETEPACRQFDVCRDPADAAVFFLYELYDDEAAIQAHLKSAHFLQMDQRTSGWVHSKVVRKLQRTAP
jgi:(4S)-4-hydroxy-5-phosphonooxypentane-2,3-dione isomerase